MKKIYTLFAASLLFANFCFSQGFTWAKQMGGTSDDVGYAVTTDVSGNVYTTGFFRGVADFDPGAGTFNMTSTFYDIFISKLDVNGNFVWAKQFVGSQRANGFGIAVDGTGNVYTTGNFSATVDFDPGSGTYNLTAGGTTYDAYVSKLDASGNFLWAKQFGSSTGNDEGRAILFDPAGNVYTTGGFSGIVDFDPNGGTFNLTSAGGLDIYVSKLDAAGNFVWAKSMGGTGADLGCAIAKGISGNIYTTGYFNSLVDFDPNTGTFNLTSFGAGDIFVSNLTAAGNFVWASQMGGTNNIEEGRGIAVDASGNVYTGGIFVGIADFDPSAATYTLNGGAANAFISKLNPSGNFVWAKSFTGPFSVAFALSIDNNSSVYTSGYFQGNTDFNAQSTSYTVASFGSTDVFINKVDQAGNFIWTKQIGGTGDDRSYAMNVDLTGNNVYTTGSWTVTSDFDPGPGTYTMSCNGGFQNDIFVDKLSCTSSPTISVNPSSNPICVGQTATLTGNGGTTYIWNSSITATSIVVSPTITTSYSVVGTNSIGCSSSAVQSITVNPLPTVTISANSSVNGPGPNPIICMFPGPPSTVTFTANGASSYTWSTGATTQSISISNTSYTTVGTYTFGVVGTGTNGCTNSSVINVTVIICSGIDNPDNSKQILNIYPNPNNGIFNLQIESPLTTLEFILTSVIGEEVYKQKVSQELNIINTNLLSKGIYFYSLMKDNKAIQKGKIVIE